MAERRKKKSTFLGIPRHVAQSEQFTKLLGNELRLLMELLLQYRGFNNGNLTTAESVLSKRGWAAGSIYNASTGLQRKGWIVVTRQGYKVRGMATLVAITWNGIDDPPKGVRYDEGVKPSPVPLGYWCKHPDTWELIPRCLQKNSSKTE
ncbi:hypothetical protein ABIE61_001809 [Marinobacterium sp. MBR-111]|jgi:hypothetical protein|uniref:hypothetical protein n=1 Tax=Marinobacterium sp. MBR-111 TaxID=3156463 RepID=UPI0033989DFC